MWTIGEAAAMFGLRVSALRYYEELGLLTPVGRRGATRLYDRAQLRRLAFVGIARELGLPLETAREVLDGAEDRWREHVRHQLDELAAQAARIERARTLLGHSLECPSPHPIADCPHLIGALDRTIEGSGPEPA